jgi:hypothetical protein
VSYCATVKIRGTSRILFHAWKLNADGTVVREKKKQTPEEEVESYVYRTKDGNIGIPGEYLRYSVVAAARFLRDPRDRRKGASDLFKKGIVSLTEMADTGKATWDWVYARKFNIARGSITLRRPMLDEGWEATFLFLVVDEEWIPSDALREALALAGRVIGIGDHRPAFGRFEVVSFEVEAAPDPYVVDLTIRGTRPILFHPRATGDSCHRTEDGNVAIPGEFLRTSLVGARRSHEDAFLWKEEVTSLVEMADTGLREPDYFDERKATYRGQAVKRLRPALREGWTASFRLRVRSTDLIPVDVLRAALTEAGEAGIGDLRPSFGRYEVVRFELEKAA